MCDHSNGDAEDFVSRCPQSGTGEVRKTWRPKLLSSVSTICKQRIKTLGASFSYPTSPFLCMRGQTRTLRQVFIKIKGNVNQRTR